LKQEFVERIRRQMPELPDARAERFIRDYAIPQI
jgi:Asp-tRNA(Asn)/Glu-tRNA(Gln) amidotransferase B subunit